MSLAPFPAGRPRRLRQADWVRRLVRETRLQRADLVQAIILHEGPEDRAPIAAMPGVARLSVAETARTARRLADLGVPALALFPHIDPALKDQTGSQALNPDGLVARAVQAIKAAAPEIGVMVDVALDPYTDHGHDGVLREGRVVNDESVARLVEQSLILAEAGADVLAPSDMMDGRIGAIRDALEEAGKPDVILLSYAAKYASAFYGPYREAIGSATALQGDKRTYQMDPGNIAEALRECALDLAEGADMLMVKPGLAYLDVLAAVKSEFNAPTLAFQVSGEYAMIKAAAERGWLDERRAMLETLQAFKRAGADAIVTYFAEAAAAALQS